MEKYLYIFNYPEYEKELCYLEFKYLFNEEMKAKHFLTSINITPSTSVYIKGRINIYQQINDLNELNLTVDDFKVQYIKNEMTHLDYKESLEASKIVASKINGKANLKNPKIIIGFTKYNNQWLIGVYEKNDGSWQKHQDKPYNYSYSLSVRNARTLVNIASNNRSDIKIVDPCCGIGTVVLEGIALNKNIKGYEINRYVAYQARLNLKHYGYLEDYIEKRDMHTLCEQYDVSILDIPYGVYIDVSKESQIELLKSVKKISSKLILVIDKDISLLLENLGYHIIDQAKITKQKFVRYVFVVDLC